MENHVYDTVIIGGGPGGYTAALYAARAGLDVLVVEKLSPGGQMALTGKIENYPGFPDGVDGGTLGQDMKKAAERFGAKTRSAVVRGLRLDAPIKEVRLAGQTLLAKTVILATGADPRPLGVEGEKALVGSGISYCGHCDGMFYRGKTVLVVGGGNSAVAEALFLSRIAKEVILIHRRDSLRATKVYHEALEKAENIRILWNSQVTRLLADELLTGAVVQNIQTGQEQSLSCQGLFVSIGRAPNTALVRGQLALDEAGYVLADESTKTSVPGVYAVGDVRAKELRQIVTAVADGAVAAHQAEQYLSV